MKRIEMGFSRKEVQQLVTIRGHTLSYYDGLGLVVPHKEGNPKKPKVRYAPSKVFQLKLIQLAKEIDVLPELSPEIFTELSLEITGSSESLISLINGRFIFAQTRADLGNYIIKLSEKTQRKAISYVYLGETKKIANAISAKATAYMVEDFDERIKNSILD